MAHPEVDLATENLGQRDGSGGRTWDRKSETSRTMAKPPRSPLDSQLVKSQVGIEAGFEGWVVCAVRIFASHKPTNREQRTDGGHKASM